MSGPRLLFTCTAGTVLGLAIVVGWLECGARVERRVQKLFRAK